MAVGRGHLEVTKYLVEAGANVEATDECGYTSFLAASECGHFDLVKYLFEIGANTIVSNRHGNTPLYSASRRVAKYLEEINA